MIVELWYERDFGGCATPPERYDVPAARNEGPTRNSGSAQGLIALICLGVDMLIGTFVHVELIERYATDGVCSWKPVFMIIAHASAVLLVLMAVLFRDDAKKQDS